MTGCIGVIVAARTMSTRLPRKALLPFQNGLPMILFLLRRLKSAKEARIVLATTDLQSDDELADVVERSGTPVFRGNAEDLVARYVAAADAFGFDTVGRVTGDCPFVNAELVDYCIGQLEAVEDFDLASTKGAFPIGLDVEFFHAATMKRMRDTESLTMADREHLTLYFYNHKQDYSVHTLSCPAEWKCSSRTFTVDTEGDIAAARSLAGTFPDPEFPLGALIEKAIS
jgi:spore coat polysaccharide biosynthesis protein SpsF